MICVWPLDATVMSVPVRLILPDFSITSLALPQTISIFSPTLIVWLRATCTVSSLPTPRERFIPTISRALLMTCFMKSFPMVWLSLLPIEETRSLPMLVLSSFLTFFCRSFSACMRRSSLPALSSNISSL